MLSSSLSLSLSHNLNLHHFCRSHTHSPACMRWLSTIPITSPIYRPHIVWEKRHKLQNIVENIYRFIYVWILLEIFAVLR